MTSLPIIRKPLQHVIGEVWPRLTQAEIAAREEARDVFFLAIRKKHGLTRAEAQIFLNELLSQFPEAA